MNSADSLAGLAVLGKTAAALVLVIGLILLLARLARHLSSNTNAPAQALRVVASTALSPKERVVIVALADTWLVLGVGGGQINKLHELPAPPETPQRAAPPGFAARFAQVVARKGDENTP